MAIINVNVEETFSLWRQKTNLLAQQQGDIALLLTPVTTNLVSAINSLISNNEENDRSVLIRSIAMS